MGGGPFAGDAVLLGLGAGRLVRGGRAPCLPVPTTRRPRRGGGGPLIRSVAGGRANGKGVLVGTYDTSNHGRAAGFYLAVL
ncbi:hypothetical protein [Streptomyces scopuliridis]|uniref:Uncharacterized protein n=1 Tax=Streptomyces scopuliridis RB72 TaxID=1440053 RepID=A0A2T7TB64_9ACTN|nr:hypothetical protein [Streptomyces scopuliridis]PVE12399.1 hypothetical protein Y717_03585 [Streptomyces scopuliridis RB72]